MGEKYDFRGENFRRLFAFAVPKDATPSNFTDKTFKNSHKTANFTKVFCYTVFITPCFEQLMQINFVEWYHAYMATIVM